MVANSDNPRVDVPPMIREELARRAEMLGGFTVNGRHTKWQLVAESAGVHPRLVQRLANGTQTRVLSTTLDLLVVRLDLIGYVDGFDGQELMGAAV